MALQSHSEEVKVAYFHVFIHHIICTVAVATVIRRRSDASPVAYIPSETAEKPQHFQPPAATRVSVEQKMQKNPHCRPKARSKTVRKVSELSGCSCPQSPSLRLQFASSLLALKYLFYATARPRTSTNPPWMCTPFLPLRIKSHF